MLHDYMEYKCYNLRSLPNGKYFAFLLKVPVMQPLYE